MLRRIEQWPRALEEYLRAAALQEFRYGVFDCCLFVCDAIVAMTGADVAAPLRGQYHSRRQAFRAIELFAGRASVEAATERITTEHHMTEISPGYAQRGDILLLDRAFDCSLAIVGLDGTLLAAAARGYERAPLSLARRAWRL